MASGKQRETYRHPQHSSKVSPVNVEGNLDNAVESALESILNELKRISTLLTLMVDEEVKDEEILT